MRLKSNKLLKKNLIKESFRQKALLKQTLRKFDQTEKVNNNNTF